MFLDAVLYRGGTGDGDATPVAVRSHSSLRQHLAAVASVVNLSRHRTDGPIQDEVIVRNYMRAAKRVAPVPRRHVDRRAPLPAIWNALPRAWEAMRRNRGGSESLLARADDALAQALVLVAIDGLARRSDLHRACMADVVHTGPLAHSRWARISFRVTDDKGSRLRGDPDGTRSGQIVFPCTEPTQLCSCCALRRWISVRPDVAWSVPDANRVGRRVVVSSGGGVLPNDEPLFVLPASEPESAIEVRCRRASADSLARKVRDVLRAAGFPNVPPHALRGISASTLLALGCPVDRVVAAGRWSPASGAVTLRRSYLADIESVRRELPCPLRPLELVCPAPRPGEGDQRSAHYENEISVFLRRCVPLAGTLDVEQ